MVFMFNPAKKELKSYEIVDGMDLRILLLWIFATIVQVGTASVVSVEIAFLFIDENIPVSTAYVRREDSTDELFMFDPVTCFCTILWFLCM